MAKVSSLVIYPVKGCQGVHVDEALVLPTGLAYDRHWLVVAGDSGRFYSQRNEAKLALIVPSVHPVDLFTRGAAMTPPTAALTLSAPGKEPLKVLLAPPNGHLEERRVTCWEWKGNAQDEGEAAAQWVSELLGEPSRLVRFIGVPGTNDAASDPTDRRRPAVPVGWGRVPGHEVAFCDRLPFLLTTEASLESLNGVLGEGQAVPMHRFRPNVVVSGTQAFEEDDWDTFTVSAPSHAPCKFKSVMPCDRCKVTTIDQKTLKSGKEPMQTLSGFRSLQHLKDKFPESKYPSKAIFFGNLCAAIGHSIIRVGDTVSADMRIGSLE